LYERPNHLAKLDYFYLLTMQKVFFIFSLLLLTATAGAQVVFKTIVKKGPVAVGESFPVQFVIENADPKQEFFPPDFDEFRIVNNSGPYVYSGSVEGPNGLTQLTNIVYTLEPTRPGKFKIRGATAMVNGFLIHSDDVWIEVIARPEPVSSENAEYFLKPGEDPYKKMRQNLFLKVMVDRTTCFVGEPITATYKLYSRLVSKSAIIKNPGFYGFTVHDMIELADKKGDIETINGHRFDVHIIRKVQLYPLRAGQFAIDPMEVTNKVEFSRNVTIHKSEQEIIEGVVDDEGGPFSPNSEMFENKMNTPAISINVVAPPEKNQPGEFTGATGRYTIKASLKKNELAKNEEGWLVIDISGQGNFTQLTAPTIKWPQGIEVFSPKITDELSATESPLKGKRTFTFSFVSAKPGKYVIPAINFSFFDSDSNRYKTVSTKPQNVVVTENEKAESNESATATQTSNSRSTILIAAGILVLLAGAVGWILWSRRSAKQKQAELEKAQLKPVLPGINELLQPARDYTGNDKGFYNTLRQCIWNFFRIHSGLSGSKMNIRDLQYIMNQKEVDEKSRLALIDILQECETGIFTDALIQTDRNTLLKNTEESLGKMV
jgi:hypothetical protein